MGLFGRLGYKGYRKISQSEARDLIDGLSDVRLIDVRRPDEYNRGHIPGAICIPEETIGQAPIERLPDQKQTLLVYCQTGRRSRKAAKKLAALGYRDVRDIGGIMQWRGPVTRH